jgi:hypothetical protein
MRARRSNRSLARSAAGIAVAALAALSVTPVAVAGATHPHTHRGKARGAQSVSGIGLQWYDITDQTVQAAAYPEAVTQSRAWAVSWLAAARAVGGSLNPIYSTAAFAQALHDTLVAQVPSRQPQLDDDLASTLASVPDGAAKRRGIAAGRQQASDVLSARQGDGLDTASVGAAWQPPPSGPGVWQPTPPSYGPALRASEGNASPFLLAADDQFDPGAPPSLGSQTYLDALAEVRAYGGSTSTVRTAEQTDVAKFWYPALNFAYAQVLRAVLADTSQPLAWQARLVAAFHVITTDAQISIYNAKFRYAFWRPVTAIRDGSVEPDPGWTPFSTTPRYPEYPSGHTGYAGAAQEVLTTFLGARAPDPIGLTSPTDPGSPRTYSDWSTITQEVVDARVWEGVHFRFSDDTGVAVGREVAEYDLPRLGSLGL